MVAWQFDCLDVEMKIMSHTITRVEVLTTLAEMMCCGILVCAGL